ncbi:MAG: SDR family NAD(P)-dependent oxidoreductase [Rickettsiaceae bacterium]|nr:SDR family NAD(P)-dependent oxidoreductase [Rickettsiaceae bacterium]
MTNILSRFGRGLNVVVIGASGGIGSGFVENLIQEQNVLNINCFSRHEIWPYDLKEGLKLEWGYLDLEDEESIKAAASKISRELPIDILILATGMLYNDTILPEKSLSELSTEKFQKLFMINTIGPALIAKYFTPYLRRDKKSIFTMLSARVGSIGDNNFGGWYSYRTSKAALNMLIKNVAIELARKYKQAIVVGLHPGTVDTKLSQPFQSNIDKVFTANEAAINLIKVMNKLTPDDTGSVFDWAGKIIEC